MGAYLPSLFDIFQYITGSAINITHSAIGDSSAFPSFDLAHANCAMTTTVAVSCTTAFAALDRTVKTFKDPANGLYALISDSDDIWVTRTTPTKHYVDDI